VSKSEQEAAQSFATAWDDSIPPKGDGWVNWSGLATLLASLANNDRQKNAERNLMSLSCRVRAVTLSNH
jgi:hypothetical protein